MRGWSLGTRLALIVCLLYEMLLQALGLFRKILKRGQKSMVEKFGEGGGASLVLFPHVHKFCGRGGILARGDELPPPQMKPCIGCCKYFVMSKNGYLFWGSGNNNRRV